MEKQFIDAGMICNDPPLIHISIPNDQNPFQNLTTLIIHCDPPVDKAYQRHCHTMSLPIIVRFVNCPTTPIQTTLRFLNAFTWHKTCIHNEHMVNHKQWLPLTFLWVMVLNSCSVQNYSEGLSKAAIIRTQPPRAAHEMMESIPELIPSISLPSPTPGLQWTNTPPATPMVPIVEVTPALRPATAATPTEMVISETLPPAFTPTPWYNESDIPEGQHSFLILGSDERGDGGFLTDVILLLFINAREGTVSIVSFPRDLYVFIPNYGQGRINMTMQTGGWEGLQEMFEYNFGIRPEHYILTNFNGFKDIIDKMDGIDVCVHSTLKDTCKLDIVQHQGDYCIFEPGVQPMNGETALYYVRSRHSTNDFDRNIRQQEVLIALARRVIGIDGLYRAPELYEIFSKNVRTDMSFDDMLPFVRLAPSLIHEENIRRFTISPNEVWEMMTPEGAMVLVPNPEAVQVVIQQAMIP